MAMDYSNIGKLKETIMETLWIFVKLPYQFYLMIPDWVKIIVLVIFFLFITLIIIEMIKNRNELLVD